MAQKLFQIQIGPKNVQNQVTERKRVLSVSMAFGSMAPLYNASQTEVRRVFTEPKPELIEAMDRLLSMGLVNVEIDVHRLRFNLKEGFFELGLNEFMFLKALQGEGIPGIGIIAPDYYLRLRDGISGALIDLKNTSVRLMLPEGSHQRGISIRTGHEGIQSVFITSFIVESGKAHFDVSIVTAGIHTRVLMQTPQLSEDIIITP